MKQLIIILLLFLSIGSMGQSTLPLRADTVVVEKTGGNGELKVKNSTRDSLGVMVNIGGGRTRFMRFRQISDSAFVVPPYGVGDTITIRGTGGNLDTATLATYFLRRKDSTFYSTVVGVRDSMYRALNSMPMTAKIEFVQSGNSTTYQNDDLIGKFILMVSGEGYIYGTVTRTTGYYSFNAGTGTITIHNSQFSDEDYVLILYRTTPIYLTDMNGNFIVDGDGNYIIIN